MYRRGTKRGPVGGYRWDVGRTFPDPKTVVSKKSRFAAGLVLGDRSGYQQGMEQIGSFGDNFTNGQMDFSASTWTERYLEIFKVA